MSKDEKRKHHKQKDHGKQGKYKHSKMDRRRTEMYEKEQNYKSPKRLKMNPKKEKRNEL